MARLTIPCPDCRRSVEVEVTSAELHVNTADGFRLLTAACPLCGELLASADPLTIDTALAAAVRIRELRRPLPPITSDDLLDLHELLADEGWCARLAAGEVS